MMPRILSARDQRPGEESDSPTGSGEYCGWCIFTADVAIEESGTTRLDIGNSQAGINCLERLEFELGANALLP